MSWDDGLVGPARDIAECDSQRLRVMAGPGTGKTVAMMRRVARLLEKTNVNPERILVCTFTRTAATDLRNELCNLGTVGCIDVPTGTLHSHCFRVLTKDGVLQITGRVPRPLMGFEERFLLQDLSGPVNLCVQDCEQMLIDFNAAWARLQSDDPGWPQDDDDRRFNELLLGWLRFHRAMLIGELIPVTLEYLRNNPACDELTAYDHVIVDEYQDLNRAEQVLLDLLAKSGCLTAVGDEDQSIYEFKQAHPEGISEFLNYHPDASAHSLEECRRCPRLVVRLANSLISSNARRAERHLAERPDNCEGEVHVVQWDTLTQEAKGIARYVRTRITNGDVEPGRILILSPRRQLGYAVRDALTDEEVPAHSFFYEEALEGQPKDIGECCAQQAFVLLTLLAEPRDIVALRCWCGFGSPSLRAGEWQRLRAYCQQSGDHPRDVLDQLVAGDIAIPWTKGLAERYDNLLARLSNLAELTGQSLIDALLPETEKWAVPLRLIATVLEDDAEDDDVEREELSPAGLQKRQRTGITQPELPTDVDYVRVMSLHKSKGLTADLVIVLGCVEGLIPTFYKSLTEDAKLATLEEQRRLFYVAITRSKMTLVLSSVLLVPRRQAHKMQVQCCPYNANHVRTTASQFLSNLGPEMPVSITGDAFLQQTGSI